MVNKENAFETNNTNVETIGKRMKERVSPEEKVKQEKIIPYLRDVLGYKLMDFEVPWPKNL